MLRMFSALALAPVAFISLTAYAKNNSENFKLLPEAPNVFEAIKQGQTNLEFRFRIQNNSVGTLDAGHANTLKSMISFESARFKDVSAIMEFSNTASYFGTKHNAGAATPNIANRPAIQDPRGAALTRGAFGFFGVDDTKLILGRQSIKLDNERHVGQYDFRQMPQTFDAIAITNESFPGFEAYYAFASHVNTFAHGATRSVGQRQLSAHLFNFTYLALPAGDMVAYGYFVGDKDVPNNSSDTYGFRFKGDTEVTTASLLYEFEYATQRGRHNNPNKYTASYFLAQGGVRAENVTVKVGMDRQAGDAAANNRAFQTPLGTKDFNGLARVFSTTPDRGLYDLFAKVDADIFGVDAYLAFHRFQAQDGDSLRFGHEYDLRVFKQYNENIKFGFEFAKFVANTAGGFLDTRKVWLTGQANF